MDQRYVIELAYNGTAYSGWQFQPNAISIQSVVEEKLTLLLKEKIRVSGAGRTDTGVHALYFTAHFDSPSNLIHPIDECVRKLNHMLPHDIVIFNIVPVSEKFNCRFSAIARTYRYTYCLRKNPFLQETSVFLPAKPDLNLMNIAAAELFNYTNFKSFCRSNSGVKTYNCKIMAAEWKQTGLLLEFTITADRFLRNMVRAITGTMLNVGFGKVTIEQFKEIIESRDRRNAGTSALAKGLALTRIEYPKELFKTDII